MSWQSEIDGRPAIVSGVAGGANHKPGSYPSRYGY